MNLGAGQPASLPYGVEPPSWYSNQYPYHSVQFSSPPQQWDLPFFSPDYHPPPPSYHPPPPSYHLPPPPNPYPPPQHNYYAPPPQHFTQPQSYPLPQHFTQPQSYPPPQHNHSATLINGHLFPLQFPYASQTQAQYYPSPHSQPNHPIAPQPLTTTPQISSIASSCTPHPNLQIHPPISPNSSHEPLVVHSHLWRARCKQVALESTATTGGVKKPSRFRLGTVLPRETGNSQKRNQLLMRKPKFQLLLGAITQDVKTSLRLHSSYVEQPETMVKLKGSGTLLSLPSQVDNPLKLGSLPPMTTPELVTATTAVHTLVGTSSPTVASVKGTYLQPKLCVKSREYHALHLFDKMPKSTGLCNAGRTGYALTTNRDKGGELAHQPEAYEINSKEEDKNVNRSVGKNDQADDGHAMLKIELSTCLIKRNDVLTHKKKVPIDEIVVGESHMNENGQFLAHKVDVHKHLETEVVNGHVSDKSGDESLIIHSHQENISEPDLADTTEESGSSNKACGCQNVHVEKSFSTIVNGDVILGYTSEAFIGMVLRFNMESTNEGKLQTTQRPATHPGIFDASHDSTKAFFELPDKGISGLITSKLECKSSLESEDLHSNVATKPVSELDDIFMGHIFMLGCTRPPEDGECWNLDGKTCSQVVRGFLDNRNATVLETLIIEAQKLDSPTIMVDISGCYGIINACIGTTLSDEAHVTFDEKNAQGIILGSYVHVPILKACSNEHKVAEAIQMLMQISNSELKMDMDLALISEYVSEDKSLHVLLQWHKLKRNSLVDGEKGLIFVDNMVDAFLYALVKGDRHPPLLLPYLIVFVMGEALTSLELLQHEYHNIDLVDLAAVIAIAFTQLHLSHEAADTYKDLIMMTGHKRDVGEYLTWTFMHSKLPHNPNSHNLQELTQRHSLVHLSELVVHTLRNLETSKCVSTGDTHRAFKYKTLPYCAGIMIQLLKKLSSNQLLLYVKPQTVSCLGDQVLIMVLYYF